MQKSCVNVNSIVFAPRGGRAHIALAYRKCVSHRADNLQFTVYLSICVWDIQGLSFYTESISVT